MTITTQDKKIFSPFVKVKGGRFLLKLAKSSWELLITLLPLFRFPFFAVKTLVHVINFHIMKFSPIQTFNNFCRQTNEIKSLRNGLTTSLNSHQENSSNSSRSFNVKVLLFPFDTQFPSSMDPFSGWLLCPICFHSLVSFNLCGKISGKIFRLNFYVCISSQSEREDKLKHFSSPLLCVFIDKLLRIKVFEGCFFSHKFELFPCSNLIKSFYYTFPCLHDKLNRFSMLCGCLSWKQVTR